METFRILTTCVWSHVKSIAFIADKNYFETQCNMPASPTPRHMKFHLQIRQLQLQYEASSQIFYCCLFVNWSEQKLIMKVCGHRTRVGWQLRSDKLIFCSILSLFTNQPHMSCVSFHEFYVFLLFILKQSLNKNYFIQSGQSWEFVKW